MVQRTVRGAGSGRKVFSTTRWSLVTAAADSRHPDYRRALGDLCAAYWHPVYAFLRRRGSDPDAAGDMTQGFFCHLLEKRILRAADRDLGRFRSFLLAALKHFVSNERDRDYAQKRGGGRTPLSLDIVAAENWYRLEPVDERTPEDIYERRWALVLLEQVLDRLHEELRNSPNPERGLRLVGCLTGGAPEGGYRRLAADLGTTESALKVAMHRMRRRFGALLREEVAHTVKEVSMVEEEIHYLLDKIGRE